MSKAAILFFSLIVIPCAQGKNMKFKDIDFIDYSITFDSAIFSGDVSSKYRGDKPYILAASDSNIIGVLECDDSIVSRLDKEYLKLTLTDRKWSLTPAVGLLAMSADDCRSLGESIVEGKARVEIQTGKTPEISYRYAIKFLPLELKVTSVQSEN